MIAVIVISSLLASHGSFELSYILKHPGVLTFNGMLRSEVLFLDVFEPLRLEKKLSGISCGLLFSLRYSLFEISVIFDLSSSLY